MSTNAAPRPITSLKMSRGRAPNARRLRNRYQCEAAAFSQHPKSEAKILQDSFHYSTAVEGFRDRGFGFKTLTSRSGCLTGRGISSTALTISFPSSIINPRSGFERRLLAHF